MRLISGNEQVTTIKLAQPLQISDKTIKRDIAFLKKEHLIKREGSDKNGSWQLLINNF